MQENDLVTVNIGKRGLDAAIVEHVNLLLKKHGLVKLKFLKSAVYDASALKDKVIKQIGRTVILKK